VARILALISLMVVGACGSTGPVKVDCGGTLRPVNPPAAVAERRP
jgi:hypothetical protein